MKELVVKVRGVGHKIKLVKFYHDFSKDCGVMDSGDPDTSRATLKKECSDYAHVGREELVVEDREIVEDEERLINLSLVSRISDTDEHIKLGGSYQKNMGKKIKLCWGFLTTMDRSDIDIVQAGDCTDLGGSQQTIHAMMNIIEIKGLGKARTKIHNRNLVELGKHKWLKKGRTKVNDLKKWVINLNNRKDIIPRSEEKAVVIV